MSSSSRCRVLGLGGLLIVTSALLCWPLAAADESNSDVELKVEEGGNEFTNSVGIKLVRLPRGKFMMGSPYDEPGASGIEWPQHQVELTKGFYLGVYEVTQKQYKEVMGNNPSYFRATSARRKIVQNMNTDVFPVECVSWDEAQAFLAKLNGLAAEKGAGRKYRLPTEAEWEYACRGGDVKQPFSFDKPSNTASSTQANFIGNQPYNGDAKGPNLNRTCKVGSYKANAFGLYDMHGNVLEWCSDNFATNAYSEKDRKDPQGPKQGDGKVLRGGAWNNAGSQCRSASRAFATFTNWGTDSVGFRVACDVRRD